MKLRRFGILLGAIVAIPLGALEAMAAPKDPWKYYQWRGTLTRTANTCNDASAPASYRASFLERSLTPLGFLTDNTTGLLYSIDFYGGSKNFSSFLSLPRGSCQYWYSHTFTNIDRKRKSASVKSWYYADCPQVKCYYEYKGKLSY